MTVTHTRLAAIVVLAAGEGTRMRSATPKVLHQICGRSLLGHIVHSAAALQPEHLVVVVGHARDQVAAHLLNQIVPELPENFRPRVTTATQLEQRGTGHAVSCALAALPKLTGTIVVANGDTPLLRPQTLEAFVAHHEQQKNAATVLTTVMPEPAGLGRIIRNSAGKLTDIVEQRDATPAQRSINEVNSGIFAFDAAQLAPALGKLTTDNDQQQEYLTDTIAILRTTGASVAAHAIADYREILGANDQVELAGLRALLRDRLAEHWMRQGVTIIDPTSVWLDVTVELAPDVVLYPNVQLYGTTELGKGVQVGPDSTLTNVQAAAGATITRSHCQDATLGENALVGPFAYLRPGSQLASHAKVGTYVEVKNSHIGVGSKVPHLSYVGDAEIGQHTNIGAATIFVNYDGVTKHRTRIGSYCRTGSDNMFVAPVTVGDGAYTGAGSVITMDVPPGALAIARAEQRNIIDWVPRRRPDTDAARAAQRAQANQDTTPSDNSESKHSDPDGQGKQ